MKQKFLGIKFHDIENLKLRKVKLSDDIVKQLTKDTIDFREYLTQFLQSEKEYKELENALFKKMKEVLPPDIEKRCDYCLKKSKKEEDKKCQIYYRQMEVSYHIIGNEYVNIILRNKHIFSSNNSHLKALTILFFKSLLFVKGKGELYINLDELIRKILLAGFHTLAAQFENSNVLNTLSIINTTIDDIDHKLVNKQLLNIEDESYLELQKTFFTNKQRFYKEKLNLEKEKSSSQSNKKLKSKGIKQPTVIHYVLYYYYLQCTKDFPNFGNHPKGKVAAIKELISQENITTTYKYFQIKYNHFAHHNINRIAKNQVANIEYVATNMLKDFPKAQQLAFEEHELAISKNR